MRSFRQMFDSFRGSGEAAVAIPSMDGSLRPNGLLDRASTAFEGKGERVVCVASDSARCLFTVGREIYRLGDGADRAPAPLATCDGLVSALATHPSGRFVLGLEGGGLFVGDATSAPVAIPGAARLFNCPVGLAFESAETVIVANGSASHGPDRWRRDLMEKNRSGGVWRVDLAGGRAVCLAKNLGYPSGVVVGKDGGLVVCEGWRHRLLLFDRNGQSSVVLDDLPGYPGSIAPSRDGGYWLAVFAPRRQLVEFVLREDGYRKQMISTLEERHWIAPAIETGLDYFEPVQSGGVRRLGMVKPWAPTRSYGLVVRLGADFNPRASYHSRAGAKRHGVTGVAEWGDRVFVACAATKQLLALDPDLTEE